MALNFDTSKLSNIKIIRNFQNMKVTDLDPESTAALPRTIEVLQPDADGAKVLAIWSGDPELAVDDYVTCQRDSTNSVWYVIGASGGTSSDLSAYLFANGSRDLTGSLNIDDGTGDSPTLNFIGGTNNDTISLWLEDDATATDSDFVIKLADAGGDRKLLIRDSGDVDILSVNSDGTLTSLGGRVKNTTRVTTTYTILITDDVVFANTDAGAYTVTLPAGVEGQTFKIINSGSSVNNLALAPNGAEHLLGANSNFALADGESLILTYNATDGWY